MIPAGKHYVVVTEHDGSHHAGTRPLGHESWLDYHAQLHGVAPETTATGPIVFETYLGSASSLEGAIACAARLHGMYGKVRIARLDFDAVPP